MKKVVLITFIFSISLISHSMEKKNEEKEAVRENWEILEKLDELTIYKKDLYLERLIQKGIVTLKDVEDIHKEIEEGLDYDNDRLDKKVNKNIARWECAVRLAPDRIKNYINRKLKNELSRHTRCHMILILGAFGVGKETLARGIAHFLGLKQMYIQATQLLNETERGTLINVRELIKDFSSRSNTALILDGVDCLLTFQNKQVIPDNIRPILRPSGHYYKNTDHHNNLLICTGQFAQFYPEGFLNEITEHVFLANPNAEQRCEIAKVMFNDRNVKFDSGAENYFNSGIKTIENLSCRNLQGIVNRIAINADLGHHLGGRKNNNVTIDDIEYVFNNL